MTSSGQTPAVVPAPVRSRARRRGDSSIFGWLCWGATWFSVVILAVLIGAIYSQSIGWLDWQLLTSRDSTRDATKAGILTGMLGTAWMILLTAIISVPLGIGAAIYLEEYAPANWLTRIIRLNLANLAGVPSIVYGILGFTVFGRMFGIFEPNGWYMRTTGHEFGGFFWNEASRRFLIPIPFGAIVLSGALTMSLLILPVIIIASQEALRAIPPSLRHASLALGATKWQTIWYQILPAAVPGIMTGVILSISRAIGETAPLIILGVPVFVTYAPGGVDSWSDVTENPRLLATIPFDKFTALPLQIYRWIGLPNVDFQRVAAAAIIVLLTILLFLNGVAIFIRNRFSRHLRW